MPALVTVKAYAPDTPAYLADGLAVIDGLVSWISGDAGGDAEVTGAASLGLPAAGPTGGNAAAYGAAQLVLIAAGQTGGNAAAYGNLVDFMPM